MAVLTGVWSQPFCDRSLRPPGAVAFVPPQRNQGEAKGSRKIILLAESSFDTDLPMNSASIHRIRA